MANGNSTYTGHRNILKEYTGLRNENLIRNNGKYRLYSGVMGMPVGGVADTYSNENGKPEQITYHGLMDYTFGLDSSFAKNLNDSYGRRVEDLGYYAVPNVKSSYKSNDYEGFRDYREYYGDTYGVKESYAGRLAGLLGVRDFAENVAYDIFPNMEGKTFADTINEILQYSDVKYAMEHDSVGIVRDINVANAIKGVITTNINNYSGKDTRLGMISNQLYARTLLYGAQFNSLRRTKYITEGLATLVGNNLSNVYSLSSFFRVNDDTGRIANPDSGEYIVDMTGGTVIDYLATVNPEFVLPDGDYDFRGSHFSPESKYFGVYKPLDEYTYEPDGSRLTTLISSNMKSPATTYGFFEEGDAADGSSYTAKEVHTLQNFQPTIVEIKGKKDILTTTNALFRDRKIDTLVSRFHTSKDKEISRSQTAVHPEFGLSRGRNLLTKSAWETGKGEDTNGYDNPYCRVWTQHHQYSKISDMIRPFKSTSGFTTVGDLQKNWNIFRNYKGTERLNKYTTLNKNGFVNITPTHDGEVDVKSCMFSIENLAWKDVNVSGKGLYRLMNNEFVQDSQTTLSPEQQGPNGGRIMWFPPYDLEFQETATANWNEANFVGRGEPVYTYNNSKRSGSLSFTLLVDHPSIVNYWMMDKKKNATEDDEQTLLRYFAGCEPIDPSEDVISKILNDTYEGGNKDVKDILPNSDIVFYTFFPNNYSGEDEQSTPDTIMSRLFGGQQTSNMKAVIDGGDYDDVFLGYEMGTNPISAYFSANTFTDDVEWTLDSVMSMSEAEEAFGLENFKTGVTVSLDDFKTSGYTYAMYDSYKLKKQDLENQKTDITNSISGLTEEKKQIEAQIFALQIEITGKSEELKTIEPAGSLEWQEKYKEISDLEEKLRAKQGELQSKDFSLSNLQNSINASGTVTNSIASAEKMCKDVENKFTGNTHYLKTEPLFVNLNVTANTSSENMAPYVVSASTAIDCYATYRVLTCKEYSTDVNGYPVGFIGKHPDEIVCKTNGSGGTKYWKVVSTGASNVSTILNEGNEEPSTSAGIIVKSKREFKNSDAFLGKELTNDGTKVKTYYLRTLNGDVITSDGVFTIDTIKAAKYFNTYESENDFIASGDKVGILNNSLLYYKYENISTSGAATYVADTLGKGLSDDEVIEKYFDGHVYTYLDEMGTKTNYGMVQYYYILTQGESSVVHTYKDLQDFVIRSNASVDKSVDGYVAPLNDGEVLKATACVRYNEGASAKEYLYPFDASKKGESLVAKNYADLRSFGLNSTYEVVRKEIADDSITCSFAEFYAGCKDGVSGTTYKDFVVACERAVLTLSGVTGDTLEQKLSEARDRMNYIAIRLNTQEQDGSFKVNSATVVGDASNDGTAVKNDRLAWNRAQALKLFLETMPAFGADEEGRRPSVINDVNNVKNTTSGYTNTMRKLDDTKDVSDITSKKERNAKTTIIVGEPDEESGVLYKTNDGAVKANQVEDYANSMKYARYDNERLFFQMLKEEDSVAYTKLVDKVKFFSPAFHSITPEGFNARLTFLQQCTRQGPTVTASDISGTTTAANLAFGRAPFCILRLGDFLNTKMLVRSVNITYPDNLWDINPDGIGVQYMMAKVQMQVEIIGGSDISAPIRRLQNAVSFNYYANTSIYDNRSDIAQYDGNGNVDNVRQWNPELNTLSGSTGQ